MKKYIIIGTIIGILAIGGDILAGEINMPGAPSFQKSVTPPVPPRTTSSNTSNGSYQGNISQDIIPQNGYSKKTELDNLALQMLISTEKRDKAGQEKYFKELVAKGVTGMCPSQIYTKQTPKCPPIKISVNGVTKKGSLCGLTCYVYEGKEYEVGYCK